MPPYRILALDIDGTLLDRSGHLRPATIAAVGRAARTGMQPVLCTGRRFRRALPIARELGLDVPLVCNSGALVKQPGSQKTLWRADLGRDVAVAAFELHGERGEPLVTFLDRDLGHHDFLVTHERFGRPMFDDYLDQNRDHVGVDPAWTGRADLAHFHLCAIGHRGAMLELEAEVHARLGDAVQTFVQRSPRYAGTMCEILRADADKWTALLRLAERWGVDPSEICAVGDDRNDIPMLRGAGLGVAMGHAAPAVVAAADRVTGSDDEDGVAALLADLLD